MPSTRWSAVALGWISPGWIILDEYNRVEFGKVFEFETAIPIGTFSPAFLKTAASTVKQAAAARKLAGVARS